MTSRLVARFVANGEHQEAVILKVSHIVTQLLYGKPAWRGLWRMRGYVNYEITFFPA